MSRCISIVYLPGRSFTAHVSLRNLLPLSSRGDLGVNILLEYSDDDGIVPVFFRGLCTLCLHCLLLMDNSEVVLSIYPLSHRPAMSIFVQYCIFGVLLVPRTLGCTTYTNGHTHHLPK